MVKTISSSSNAARMRARFKSSDVNKLKKSLKDSQSYRLVFRFVQKLEREESTDTEPISSGPSPSCGLVSHFSASGMVN